MAKGLEPDEQLFMEQLFITRERIIYKTARKYTSSEFDAEEAVQDALERLMSSVTTLQSLSEAAQTAYLVVAVKNAAINCGKKTAKDRKNGKYLSEIEQELPSPDAKGGMDEVLIEQEVLAGLRAGWCKLDESSRSLLEQKYILKMTDREMAHLAGVKEASIRMMLTRARGKLLSQVKEGDAV